MGDETIIKYTTSNVVIIPNRVVLAKISAYAIGNLSIKLFINNSLVKKLEVEANGLVEQGYYSFDYAELECKHISLVDLKVLDNSLIDDLLDRPYFYAPSVFAYLKLHNINKLHFDITMITQVFLYLESYRGTILDRFFTILVAEQAFFNNLDKLHDLAKSLKIFFDEHMIMINSNGILQDNYLKDYDEDSKIGLQALSFLALKSMSNMFSLLGEPYMASKCKFLYSKRLEKKYYPLTTLDSAYLILANMQGNESHAYHELIKQDFNKLNSEEMIFRNLALLDLGETPSLLNKKELNLYNNLYISLLYKFFIKLK